MVHTFNRKIRIVSAILIAALLVGFLPWRELSADSATHGEYTSSPFTVTYEQNSTWGNSTQGQFEVTNTSAYDITSWSLEIDYLYDVSLTNIWNVSGTVADGNVIVSSNSTIESGQTYTFGLIVEGQDSSHISPASVTTLDYVSSQPNVTPTPTPTEEPTPTGEPTEEPTDTPTVTVTPTPFEEQTEVFPYAIFSASTTDDFVFQGWKSNIVGDIYSGKDFLYQGSELTMTGFARTVGIVNPSGWKTSMTGAQEHIQPLPIPDWSLSILAKEDDMPSISETDLTSQDSVIANGYYYTNGNITINGAEFTGDAVIVAHGDITYNVNSLNAGEEATGRILLYSEEGNITINGTQIEINGILYAPNGRVSINAYNTTLNGRIVADRFSYNGSILDVTADPSDLQLVSELPQVTVTASSSQVTEGQTAYFTIEIPQDNVYEILYRLNGTNVEVTIPVNEEDPIRYNLNTGSEGIYTLEAYVELPYGTFVLDSDTITVTAETTTTPTDTPTPTEEPIETPTATPTNMPSPTDTPTPTSEPTDTPTPTEEPTDTPTPTEEPTPTPINIGYYPFSEGDMVVCGYKELFDEEDWDLNGSISMNETRISFLNKVNWTSASATFLGSRTFSPDYSFNGRFTMSLDYKDAGGWLGFYVVPHGSTYDSNSIGVYVSPNGNEISILVDDHAVSTASYMGFSDMGAYNDIWYEYDGETNVFSVYAAKYSITGNVTKPSEPLLSYEIDLSDKFSSYEDFSLFLNARNGLWTYSTDVIHGIELDPYPELNEEYWTVTPTPTATPSPASEGFIAVSQGNTDYGYQVPFIENAWYYRGEASYVSGDSIDLVDTNSDTYYGSSFLSFTEDVGEDYEFYTRFTFSHENELSQGLAFVIEPASCIEPGFYGHTGYNLHQNSLIVEFDFDPQQNYVRFNDYGEFVRYDESNSHVAVVINGNEERHYAVADYPDMRGIDKITDCWVDYDGQTLKVYVCAINEFGHIYKYEEPLLQLNIDLEDLFGGESDLKFGFISGDIGNRAECILHGFEISDEPISTLLPTELPLEEQDRYQILSMGDSTYNYLRRFRSSEWTITQGDPSITENAVTLSEYFGADAAELTGNVTEFSPDYSFAGRFTYTTNCGPNDGNSSAITFFDPDKGIENGSFSIHIDINPNDNHYWKDPYGQGEWQYGIEPYNSSIGIYLNGDGMREYCYAEYLGFRDSGSVHEIWFEYDGHDKILYVYVAPYDSDGNVQKPSTPTLMLNIDLAELFGGAHRFGIELIGDGGWDPATFIYRGIEVDPYPAIHNGHESNIEILEPSDGDTFYIGETIDVFGRINNEDADTVDVTLTDESNAAVFSDTTEPNHLYSTISSIDTDGLTTGEYTLTVSISADNTEIDSEEIGIELIPDPVIEADITGNDLTGEGMDVIGTIDITEDSEYILYRHNTTDDSWTEVSEDTGNKDEESLGFIDIDDLPESSVYLRLVVTLECGRVVTVYKTFEYDKYAILHPDEPTPTPTQTPIEFTDEELYVDILDSQDGEEVTFITDIEGTVTGTELQYYSFEVFPSGSEDAVYSYTSDESVEEGILGTIDPTLLMNGYYKVKVTANAEDGYLSDEIIVLVTGQAKVGNFTISFLDMSLPVAGLPVEVYRTYDSRQRTMSGDFGYGWTMSLGGPDISISTDLGEDWETEERTVLGIPMYYWTHVHPHEVYVDWGNGNTETFELVMSPDRTANPNNWPELSASFTNTSGTSDTLTILDEHEGLLYADNSIYTENMDSFAPQNFLLTRYDGIKFYFNSETGLYKIEDTYGRTIEITEDGVFYSDGSSINFVRNEQGQITSITDGTYTVTYTYDANGDLVSVTDKNGNVSSFTYEDHYITGVTAADGTSVSTNQYDDDGRLISTTDANGNTITFDHDIDSRVETVTNRLGYTTVYTYDENGNVLTQTDALGNTTTYTYDGNNNKISETDPLGNTVTYSYDANYNLTGATNAEGVTASESYSATGQVTSVTLGGTTALSLIYDSYGNLSSATDALGNTQTYSYSNEGKLTSLSDSIGDIVSITYDGDGNAASVTNSAGMVTTFTYDEYGRAITSTTTYRGQSLTDTYTYDANDNITKVVSADGTVTSYTYDVFGNMTSQTNSFGTTGYTYDIYGNLTNVSYPDGTSESFVYDAENQVISATDRYGKTSTYTYDAAGNLKKITYSNGTTKTYTYDACGRVTSITLPSGAVTTYGYDSIGRNTSVTDDDGNTTTYTYNDLNLVSGMTDPNGNTYSFSYDDAGNQTGVTYPNGGSYSAVYDVRGRLVSETDALGNTTAYSYDDSDNLTSVTDSLGNTTSYSYDEAGNLTSVTDALGNETTYSYDSYGRLVSQTNALGQTASVTYNAEGLVDSATDFGGNTTDYSYDSLGMVTSAAISGSEITYTYDSYGNALTIGDNEYTYTGNGQLASKTDAAGNEISYTYNSDYQLTGISTDGASVSYSYDKYGRIETVTDGEGNGTSYTYDNVGNLETVTYPNGVVTTYGYDSTNLIISICTVNSDGDVLQDYNYTRDLNGNIVEADEGDRTVYYEYDALGRLTSETVEDSSGTHVTEYTYDANSNRLSKTVDGVVITYTYNEINQLVQAGSVTYTYDASGNLVAQSDNGVLTASYEYDEKNQLIKVTTAGISGEEVYEFEYDAAGNRISQTINGVTTKYIVDSYTGYSQVLKSTEGSNYVSYTKGFGLISRYDGTETLYYLSDVTGTTRALVDEDGNVTDTYVFDGFGNLTESTGTTENSYGFQGEEQDETGLIYLRARYMDPETGRFLSMDTYGGNLANPISQNRYLFANSNPIRYSDPSGHYTLTEQETAMAIQGIIGEAVSGVYYIVDMVITDPQMERHSLGGLLFAMLGGFVFGAACGAIRVSDSAWAFKIIVGALGIESGSLMYLKALCDYNNGHTVYGTLEALYAAMLFICGLCLFLDGSQSMGSYTGSGFNNQGSGNINTGNTNAGQGTTVGEADISQLPQNVQDAYNNYSQNGWQGNYKGQTPGTAAGGNWLNSNNDLPSTDSLGNSITYKEYDVNSYVGPYRDGERFIVGTDGSVYYTDSHYGEGVSLNGLPDFVKISP